MKSLRPLSEGLAVGVIALALVQLLIRVSYADDAVVLPKGVGRLFVETHFFIPFGNRFNQDRDSEPFAKPFNLTLDNSVFTSLPPGFNLGRSVVSFERHVTEMLIQPSYGLTDRFTVGVNIPYTWYENRINAAIDTSGANLGFNPVTGAFLPIALGGRPANVNDINRLLGTQFGLKPIQTFSDSGIGDVEVGGKYLYYKAENFRAAATAGVRFPTGKKDDPDNLVDSKIGDGAYALGVRFHQDYLRQSEGLGKRLGYPDPGEFMINTTFRYDWNLPDKRTLRVCAGGGPFCNIKDDVRTKIGDVLQAEISARIGFLLQGLNFSPLYMYGYKFKDHYSGDRSLDYGSINKELDRTEQTEHIYILTLTYATIPLYVQKMFPFPFVVQVSYRDRFAGSGGKGDSRFIGLTIQAYF